MNEHEQRRRWIFDLILGGTVGAIVGVLAALSFMICTAGGVVFVHHQRVGHEKN